MKPRREPVRKSQTSRERLNRALDQMEGGKRTSAYTKEHKKGTGRGGGAEHMTGGLMQKAAEAHQKYKKKVDEGY